MKKLLTVSLLAMMAVGTARADIASTTYADTVAKNKADAAQEAAIEAIGAETTRATAAEAALGVRIDGLTGEAGILSELDLLPAVTETGKAIVSVSQENGQLAASVGTIGTAGIDNGAVTTDKIADKNVTKDKLNDAVQASLNKADVAAPQATTYTMEQVDAELAKKQDKLTAGEHVTIVTENGVTTIDAKISDDAVADPAAQKVMAPSFNRTQLMINDSMMDSTSDIAALKLLVGETGVSTQISTAVAGLNGSDETVLTADGSYVLEVTQTNGIVESKTVAFDTAMSDTSINAVQNKVVKKAIDDLANGAVATNTGNIGELGSLTTTAKGNLVAAINDVDLAAADAQADATQALADAAAAQGTADAAMNFELLKTDDSWTAAKCDEANAVCSLVSKNGSIAWERVQP